MTLSEEQTTTIRRWLDEQWLGKARCPAGHDDAWVPGESMAFVPGFELNSNGSRIAHELGLRFIVQTCGRCGYVAFLDADTVGLSASPQMT